LTCAVPGCQAAFGAICLKECGCDAHQHVRDTHQGGIFDKGAFKTSTKICAKEQFDILMNKLAHESFELRQLVLNHVEKANLLQDMTGNSNNAPAKMAAFLKNSKASHS
jgi:hypothetical protein